MTKCCVYHLMYIETRNRSISTQIYLYRPISIPMTSYPYLSMPINIYAYLPSSIPIYILIYTDPYLSIHIHAYPYLSISIHIYPAHIANRNEPLNNRLPTSKQPRAITGKSTKSPASSHRPAITSQQSRKRGRRQEAEGP